MRFKDERKTCVIICTGESAGRIDPVSLERIRKFCRIAVNDGYILEPGAEAVYGCDPRWWRFHGPAVQRTFAGLKYCPDESIARAQNLIHIPLERKPGLCLEPNKIFSGGAIGNSGAQAINLAYSLGARRLVLVGMDMGGSHFFGEHPKGLNVSTDFEGMKRSMSDMAADLHRLGVQVVNTSDCSNIGYWPGKKPVPLD